MFNFQVAIAFYRKLNIEHFYLNIKMLIWKKIFCLLNFGTPSTSNV